MNSVYDCITRLASTAKRKEKEQILTEIKESHLNEEFKRVAFLALDPRHRFNIVEYDESEILNEGSSQELSLSEGLDIIENGLLNEGLLGNDAKKLLFDTTGKLSSDDKTVLKHVIDRTLKCGVSDKTINKVWENLVYVHPYRRCSSFSKKNMTKVVLPAYSQLKEDGMYVDIVVHNGIVEYRSRVGGYFQWNTKKNDSDLSEQCSEYVLMGEALVLDDDGTIMERKKGNGYLNGDDVDPERIIFSIWDAIPYSDWVSRKSKQTYDETYKIMVPMVEKLSNSFRVVDTRMVHCVEDIVSHFKDNIRKGLEGSVIKNTNSVWKDGTSTDHIKIKIIFDVELEVVEVYEGQKGKKYEGMAGGLRCRTSDHKMLVDVGGGFKDNERSKYFDNPEDIVGKIVTVKACDISKTDDNEYYTLINPRFIEERNDKSEADNLERVNEQKEASIQSLDIIT